MSYEHDPQFDLDPRREPTRGPVPILIGVFVLCAFGTLTLPMVSGAESILAVDGGQAVGFVVLAAGTLVLAIAGTRIPLLGGIAAGLTALISTVFTVVYLVGTVFTELFGDFGDIPWSGGAYAYGAAAVAGVIAVTVSAVAHWPRERRTVGTPVPVLGVISSSCVAIGFVIPQHGSTFALWNGFDTDALLGFTNLLAMAMIAIALAVGFLGGPWGAGLHIGYLGFALFGWLIGADAEQVVIGWTGTAGGGDYHGLTIAGFWATVGLAVVNGVTVAASSSGPSARSSFAPRTLVPRTDAPGAPADWYPDPYGWALHRYFDGRRWTTHVSQGQGAVEQAPTELCDPHGGAADWYPDPCGLHEHRYFDGQRWTRRTADGGVEGDDPVRIDPPVVAPVVVGDTVPLPPPPPSPDSPAPEAEATLAELAAVDTPDTGATRGQLAPIAFASGHGAEPPHEEDATTPTPLLLVLSDGRQLPIDGPIVLGRAPTAPSGYEAAELVALADSTVSGSHALIGMTNGRAWICDLDSANGVAVEGRTGPPIQPGDHVALAVGAGVVLGDDTAITIERGSGHAR